MAKPSAPQEEAENAPKTDAHYPIVPALMRVCGSIQLDVLNNDIDLEEARNIILDMADDILEGYDFRGREDVCDVFKKMLLKETGNLAVYSCYSMILGKPLRYMTSMGECDIRGVPIRFKIWKTMIKKTSLTSFKIEHTEVQDSLTFSINLDVCVVEATEEQTLNPRIPIIELKLLHNTHTTQRENQADTQDPKSRTTRRPRHHHVVSLMVNAPSKSKKHNDYYSGKRGKWNMNLGKMAMGYLARHSAVGQDRDAQLMKTQDAPGSIQKSYNNIHSDHDVSE